MDTLRKIYGKDYYSGDKSFEGKQIYKVATEGILKLIIDRGYRSGRLLDIGCGTGYFLYVAGGIFETYGVEVSNYAINEARKYINVMLYLLDVCKEPLPFPSYFFDVIVSFDVIEHLPDDMFALKEAHRCLRKGGLLLATTFNPNSKLPRLERQSYDYTNLNVHNGKYWKRRLAEAGFDAIDIKYCFAFGVPPPRMMKKLMLEVYLITSMKTPVMSSLQ